MRITIKNTPRRQRLLPIFKSILLILNVKIYLIFQIGKNNSKSDVLF